MFLVQRVNSFDADGSAHDGAPVTPRLQDLDAGAAPGTDWDQHCCASFIPRPHIGYFTHHDEARLFDGFRQTCACAGTYDAYLEIAGGVSTNARNDFSAQIPHRVGIGVVSKGADKQK